MNANMNTHHLPHKQMRVEVEVFYSFLTSTQNWNGPLSVFCLRESEHPLPFRQEGLWAPRSIST